MGQPKVSVVIPHLNEPDDLRACLTALLAQRSDSFDFEIIVVDNGSRELPAFATGLSPKVRLLQEMTPGPGPARNLGAGSARAPLIAFIDADCLASPGWLAEIVHHFDANPDTDFAGGDIRIRPAGEHLTAIECYENVYSYRTKAYVERQGFAATGNMAVRAEVFRAVGPFGGIGTMEDTEWGKRATAAGYSIAYLPNARVYTPSCRSFSELIRRWDRHIAHEFQENRGRSQSSLRWLGRTALMAASPLGEIVRVAQSERARSWRERLLALGCVTRVRLYRAQRMLGLAWRDNAASMLDIWNREHG